MEFEELVFDGLVGAAAGGEFHADEALGVEVGDEEVLGCLFAGRSARITAIRAPEAAAADGDVAEVVHDGHGFEGAREMGDGFELVGPLVNAAIEPVDEGVAAGLGVVEVLHADDVAAAGEIDFDRVVTAAERVPGDIAAIWLAAPDAAGERGIDRCAVLLLHIVAFAAVAPVKAAVRMQKRAVDVSSIPGVVEAGDDLLALVGHAVVVGIRELPNRRRRGDVEAAVQPARALREGHLVGKEGALVESAILVGVFEHEDAVRRIFLELLLVPIHARGIADEEAALVIEAAHDRVRDERRRGGDFERVASGEIVLWQSERRFARDDDGALGAFRNGVSLVRRQIGGEDGKSEEGQESAHGDDTGRDAANYAVKAVLAQCR